MKKAALIIFITLVFMNFAKADFELTGNQHLDVTTAHLNGRLYDSSSADLLSGYLINAYVYDQAILRVRSVYVSTYLGAYQSGSVIIAGGSVRGIVETLNSSSLTLSDGTISGLNTFANSRASVLGGIVEELNICGSSNALITGGEVRTLYTSGTSTTIVSGGTVNNILAQGGSIVFSGNNFVLGEGLWSSGNFLCGTGTLTGQWLDGTPWTTRIHVNTVTMIQLIPEPCTLLLLGMGGLLIRRR